MSTTYKINEVARRSGFTTATLRYYEEIGLVPSPERTDSGYRVYNEGHVDRLAFIARAKQLGCSLEETGELLVAWDGGQCGPVQDRLRSLVASKVSAAEHSIAELTALRLQLLESASALNRHRPDGPCDDSCGCTTVSDGVSLPAQAPAPVRLTAKPLASAFAVAASADVPIVCTANAASATKALHDWAVLLASQESSLVRTEIDGGVRLQFAPGVDVAELVRLTMAEHDCCRFFSFAITVDPRGVGLDVVAPDDALSVVHALFGGSK